MGGSIRKEHETNDVAVDQKICPSTEIAGLSDLRNGVCISLDRQYAEYHGEHQD